MILPPFLSPPPVPAPAVRLMSYPLVAAGAEGTEIETAEFPFPPETGPVASRENPFAPAFKSTSAAFNSISVVVEGTAASPTIIVRALALLPMSMFPVKSPLPIFIAPLEEFICNAFAASIFKSVPAFRATPPTKASSLIAPPPARSAALFPVAFLISII